MGFFYFLGQKKFYLHLLIAILLTLLLLWGVLQSLAWYTRHGQVYLVPDFKGQTLQQLNAKHYNDYFDLQVIDSVYSQKYEPGAIVMQNPLPDSKVKKGRNIYLTIVAKMPEMVKMPDLKNLSLRQALVLLDENGLEVERLNYIEYFAKNAVVEQLLAADDQPIETGTKLAKGTKINLVVGKGNTPSQIPIPFIIGDKMRDAHTALHYASLNVGNEYYLDGNDTTHARVFKIEPAQMSHSLMNPGDSITIWYRSDENFDFNQYIQQLKDSTAVDSTVIDSASIDTSAVKNPVQPNDSTF
ncbi:MAG: PASTA domain-containing protein [Bacteroidales bacterium]|nr:PASTA domain-containing protein [Bacteroidales bacterium]